MKNNTKTILIADDDYAVRTVLSQALKRAGYAVEATDNGVTLYQWVMEGRGDLVITDVMMPGENGLDLVPKIHRRRPDMKVIVMSAQNALTTAVAASEKGALDYLPKPFDVDQLTGLVEKALRQGTHLVKEQDNLEVASAMDRSFVVGKSRAMQEIYRTIARLRSSDFTVLLSGESGTGKEVIARALHEFSSRKSGPFVALNMAAIPKELIESELFGHEKGAFTGAVRKMTGKFEQASGGTLFLDEIGDMPFEAQTRLLRVLQDGVFMPVGSARAVRSNARIIAATHQNLPQAVAAGRFREDLFYRLNVIPLAVPPLRERPEDIAQLTRHFIGKYAPEKVISPAAMRELEEWHWPGNIRELENFIRRIAVLAPGDVIEGGVITEALKDLGRGSGAGVLTGASLEDLSCAAQEILSRYIEGLKGDLPAPGFHDAVLRLVEKPLIEKILTLTRGNQIRAAALLGLNRNTLRKKIADLGIEVRRNG